MEWSHRHRYKITGIQVLHEIDQAILMGEETAVAIAERALERIYTLLGPQHVSLATIAEESGSLKLLAKYCDCQKDNLLEKEFFSEFFQKSKALQDGKVFLVNNIEHYTENNKLKKILQQNKICSFIDVPLLLRNQPVGLLKLYWDYPDALGEEDQEIAAEISAQITLALEQNRLRRALKQHAAELEQRVNARTKQLKQANEELEAFSYSVSHDLRAPLRSIDGYVQILLEDFGPELNQEGQRICNVISQSAKKMGQLIDDLLTFSRISRKNLAKMELDMQRIVSGAYEELITSTRKDKICFQIKSLPSAWGDANLIKQVWSNLISNALKFSAKKEQAIIVVSAEKKAGTIIYCIEDNGAGFDMEYVKDIFGVFKHLHTEREFAGTGVGLAIVERIIKRHGGQIWAKGAVNQGAKICFSLAEKGTD